MRKGPTPPTRRPTSVFGTATKRRPTGRPRTPDFADRGVASVPRATPALYHSLRGAWWGATPRQHAAGFPIGQGMWCSPLSCQPPLFPSPTCVSGENRGSGKRHEREWDKSAGAVQVSQLNSRCLSRDVCSGSSEPPFFSRPHRRHYHHSLGPTAQWSSHRPPGFRRSP